MGFPAAATSTSSCTNLQDTVDIAWTAQEIEMVPTVKGVKKTITKERIVTALLVTAIPSDLGVYSVTPRASASVSQVCGFVYNNELVEMKGSFLSFQKSRHEILGNNCNSCMMLLTCILKYLSSFFLVNKGWGIDASE